MYDDNAKIYEEFDLRLSRIARDRARMVYGYKAVVAEDGLIVFRAARSRRQMPLRALVFVLVAGLAFKAVVLGTVGPDVYDARLNVLRAGSAVERFAATVLAPDVVTRLVLAQVKVLLG